MDMSLYEQIFDNLPEGVAVCNSSNQIIEANKNFEAICGFSKKELIGKNLLDILKFSKEPAIVSEDDDVESFQLAELTSKNKKLNCVRVNISCTPEQNIIYLVIPFANIAFLNQAHIDFVSTVSHELRTPLTSIKGFADTLLSAGGALNSEQQTRFVSIIKSQVDRLTRLVENLLTVSKLEARQTKTIYKAVELDSMIDGILCSIQHKAKDHKIEVDILPNLPAIWADADKLEQVLMNLVDNAVKYSSPGTSVKVKAGFVQNNTDMIEVRVKDQGFGIPEEFIDKIFTKFSRIDSPLTRGVQGTGLGLYITKSLVTSMKGEITVESSDKGSTFILTLPAASHELYTQQKFQEKD